MIDLNAPVWRAINQYAQKSLQQLEAGEGDFRETVDCLAENLSHQLSYYDATAYALLMNNCALLPINVSGMFVGDVTQRKEMGGALSVVMMILMIIAMAANNAIVNRQKKGGMRK